MVNPAKDFMTGELKMGVFVSVSRFGHVQILNYSCVSVKSSTGLFCV